jgi:hypothetical protein
MTPDQVRDALAKECDALKELLLAKNKAYGSSASEPARVFSKASPLEALLVRADDKLSRIRNLGLGGESLGESARDSVRDLAGYCVLILALTSEAKPAAASPTDGARYVVHNVRGQEVSVPLAYRDAVLECEKMNQIGGCKPYEVVEVPT